MDDADPPSAAPGGESGILGNLPTTRPQHRSARRGGAAPASPSTSPGARPPAPTGPAPRRRPTPKPTGASPTTTSAPTPAAPDVPAPPPAPRSGWATPKPEKAPAAPLPPLVALADGAVRTGTQLLRGVLRRLPRG